LRAGKYGSIQRKADPASGKKMIQGRRGPKNATKKSGFGCCEKRKVHTHSGGGMGREEKIGGKGKKLQRVEYTSISIRGGEEEKG